MPASARISAVIITYNEERNIERCIRSVTPFADEILVVDSFSNDRTTEIARSLGARVILHPFEGYIEQKNYAASQALYPVVFSLDADEAADEELSSSVQHIKNHWKGPAYSVNRLNNYCGQWIYHSGWYPEKRVRLFDREQCYWGGINPHDKIMFADKGGKPLHLKGNLLHYSFLTIAEHLRQTENFSTIAARAMFDRGIRPSLVKRFLSPVAKFLKAYFLDLGILDGYHGYMISRISAKGTWLKYYKLHKLYQQT